MTWAPNVPTEEEVEGFVEDLMAVTPEILGIDETLPGCEIIDMNPYGVPAGTLPRYIKVAIREYYQDVFYRGGIPGLSVGDFVSVTHFREGNRYEVTGAGGSGGSVLTLPVPGGQGWAMISDAVPEWVASLTPTWLGTHTWGSGFALMPTDAAGQDLGDATHRWDLYTQEVYFGGATGANVITVPDNVADALHVLDVGGLEHLRVVSTNVNPYLLIDPAGAGVDVGIATPTPEGKLDVAYGGNVGRMTLLLGADVAASTRTNVTNKRTLVGAYHYTNIEEPVGMMYVFSSGILNRLNIGGGTIFFNAATQVSIYTAANTTTQTGTERLKVDSAGAITVTGPSLTVPAAWNLIVPDNVANAIRLIDNGAADIFLQIITTTGSEEVIFNAGGDDVDFTVQAVGVADALQVRGSDGQITLGVLTAGYVKSNAGGVLSIAIEVPLVDLGSYTQGDLIYGGAADWQDLAIGGIGDFLWVNAAGTEPEWHTLVVGDIPAHALLGTRHSDTTTDAPTRGSLIYANATPLWDELDHPAAAGYALTTDANDVVWDQTPLWSGAHTHAADIILDDGVGDSPQLQFVGGSNNDTVLVYLDDDAVANDSDLVIRLCAADTGSQLIIQDNSPTAVAYIDADGNADFVGHMAIGANAAVHADYICNLKETYTVSADKRGLNVESKANYAVPSAHPNTAFTCLAIQGSANAMTSSNALRGYYGGSQLNGTGLVTKAMGLVGGNLSRGAGRQATEQNAVVARATAQAGSTATVTTQKMIVAEAPTATGGGLWTFTNLYGLYVETMAQGSVLNYSIYTNVGLVHFGDQVEIIGSAAADIQLIVKGAAAQSASLVQYQDSAGNIFFDSGDGLAVSEVVWNEQGLDIDFRVEAVGQLNALFVQGSEGRVGIGCVPGYRLDVRGDVASFVGFFYNDGNNNNRTGIMIQCGADTNSTASLVLLRDGDATNIGSILGDGAGGVTYWSASDERLKNILGPIDPAVAIKALVEVDPIQYVGKGLTEKTGRKNFGFAAQEIHKHFPEVATYDEEEDLYGLSYERLVPVLWAQNQALLSRIEQLEK